jgi:hypothetical protein
MHTFECWKVWDATSLTVSDDSLLQNGHADTGGRDICYASFGKTSRSNLSCLVARNVLARCSSTEGVKFVFDEYAITFAIQEKQSKILKTAQAQMSVDAAKVTRTTWP